MTDGTSPPDDEDTPALLRVVSPAAQRALTEAAARRAQANRVQLPQEKDGPKGIEPTRFGDWERKGIAYDF
jgi:hypothetical protein